MLKLLALTVAAACFATAQDITAEIPSATSDTDLLAFSTITTACLPAVDTNNEPIFSIQTDTNVDSCTYVVNADNTAQVVSTIGAVPTATRAGSTSDDVSLSTLTGTNTSGPPVTTATTISTDSSSTASEPSTPDTTSATSKPVETPTEDAAGKIGISGEVLGVVGLMAMLAAL